MAHRQRMLKPIRRLLLLMCCAWNTHAGATRLLLILSSDQPYYRQTAASLQENLPDVFSHQTVVNSAYQPATSGNHDMIVAIGTKATKKVLYSCPSTPTLSIFIPRTTFESLLEIYHGQCQDKTRVSSVYLDQPLHRFFNLAKHLKPNAKSLGVVLGPASTQQLQQLEALAQQRGLILKHAAITDRDNPIAALRPLVVKSDLVLPLPDEGAINRAVAKWVLNLSFQNKTPVIGFSHAYAEAGAVAALFSSPEDIGLSTSRLIAAWAEGNGRIWTPRHPKHFTIKTNLFVSRSLGLHPADLKGLQQQVEHMEQQP